MKRSERIQRKATRAAMLAVLVAMLWLAMCAGGWRMCQEFQDLPALLPSVFLGCVAGLCFVVRSAGDAVGLRRQAKQEAQWENKWTRVPTAEECQF